MVTGKGHGDVRGLRMFYTFIVVMVTQVYTFVSARQKVHLPWVHFIVSQSYFCDVDFKDLIQT